MEQNGKRIVYADNAATTAVSPAVLDAMLPFYKELYGNPSSLYSLGNAAKKPLEEAREKVARCLGADANAAGSAVGTDSTNYKACYVRASKIFKTVSKNFAVEWDATAASTARSAAPLSSARS